MKNYPKYVKRALNHVIHDMGKHPDDFCIDPGRNFTRNRKLHFEDILSILVKMGGKSLRNEMLNSFGYSDNTVTVSAFVQQRAKIKPEALAYLYQDHQLLAVPSLKMTNLVDYRYYEHRVDESR